MCQLSGTLHPTLGPLVLPLILGAYAVAEVSDPSSPLSVSQYLMGQGNRVVLAHMVLAVPLLLLGLVALALAISARRSALGVETGVGLVFLAVAALGGYRYLFVTYQSNPAVLPMVGGFVAALVLYAIALVSTRGILRGAPAVPA